jgi:hypothetical protein
MAITHSRYKYASYGAAVSFCVMSREKLWTAKDSISHVFFINPKFLQNENNIIKYHHFFMYNANS